MTLGIGVLTPERIHVVTDRLVSQAGPYDRNASKTLVYVAPDGVLVGMYCGVAFIGQQPTDDFLAAALCGGWPEAPGPCMESRDGPIPIWHPIGPALGCWFGAIATAFASGQVPRVADASLRLVAHWYHWPYGRGSQDPPVPGAMILSVDPGHREVTVRHRQPNSARATVAIGSGATFVDETDLQARLAELRGDSVSEITLLAAEVERVSAEEPDTVGPDCVVVSVSQEPNGPGLVSYRSRRSTGVNLGARTVLPSEAQVAEAFGPWLIGPGLANVPSALRGAGWDVDVGGYTFRLDAPDSAGGFWAMAPSPRRPPPAG